MRERSSERGFLSDLRDEVRAEAKSKTHAVLRFLQRTSVRCWLVDEAVRNINLIQRMRLFSAGESIKKRHTSIR